MTLTALDLFSGAGGFSLGLKQAGVSVAGSVEADRFAASTYKRNFSSSVVANRSVEECSDRWLRSHFSDVDIVAGGPPCQGFSVAGPLQYGRLDARNALVLEMARVVKCVRPRFAVLENVRGILSGKLSGARMALDAYLASLQEARYFSTVVRLQAADFGVPQLRERVFVISSRDEDALKAFEPLIQRRKLSRLASSVCFGDLPTLNPGEGTDEVVPYPRAAQNKYQLLMRRSSSGVANHVAMKHTPRMLARLAVIGHGDSMKDVSSEHGQRKRNSGLIDAGQRYKMNCTRINPKRPSISVPANFQTIHVHPHQHRMLTAREGARLQGFPDSFVFTGPRTLMSRKLLEREGRTDEIGLSQYNQIGNAVPPPLARAIGETLLELCDEF
ncbi:DNA cytosine methyltransferase [Bradyrhizobium sp. TM239]|uniref:DNA cytosine methyltransferase n=1 Tax=Bradyrhizobium sp. TM239 TaxID=2599802 RepID=UPI0030C77848